MAGAVGSGSGGVALGVSRHIGPRYIQAYIYIYIYLCIFIYIYIYI